MNYYGLNGYYSCLGASEPTDMFIEIRPEDIPADMYALWFMPSWGTVMSNDPRYAQWGWGNSPRPRKIRVRKKTK